MMIDAYRYIGVIIKLDETNQREAEIVVQSDMKVGVEVATNKKAIEYQRRGIPCVPVVYVRED